MNECVGLNEDNVFIRRSVNFISAGKAAKLADWYLHVDSLPRLGLNTFRRIFLLKKHKQTLQNFAAVELHVSVTKEAQKKLFDKFCACHSSTHFHIFL